MSKHVILLGLVLLTFVELLFAQDKRSSNFSEWSQARYQNPGVRYAWPDRYRAFTVDLVAIADRLKSAPSE
ncbi:MAG: hypothetical protein ACKOQY_04055, partial [Bacteroidota bacterium]